MQKIYLLSGLGADRRVFERLSVSGELVHIEWLIPDKNESLPHYCKRLINEYSIEHHQVLLGVSLGGIVAIEIAKLIQVKQVIIISSVKNNRELPFFMRVAGYLHLYKLLPYSLLKKPGVFLRFAFSPISDSDYTLLKKIIADTQTPFLRWAIKRILLWRSDTVEDKLVHLHGTSDKIFPFRNSRYAIAIQNGGHFMIYNRATEVSSLINRLLSSAEV